MRKKLPVGTKEYASRLLEDGMDTILRYGIACRKKRCRIKVEK